MSDSFREIQISIYILFHSVHLTVYLKDRFKSSVLGFQRPMNVYFVIKLSVHLDEKKQGGGNVMIHLLLIGVLTLRQIITVLSYDIN